MGTAITATPAYSQRHSLARITDAELDVVDPALREAADLVQSLPTDGEGHTAHGLLFGVHRHVNAHL